MVMHAIIKDNVVTALQDINSDEEYYEVARHCQNAINVDNWAIMPSVGWLLSGSRLVPPTNAPVSMSVYVNSRIKQFQDKAPALLRDMYTANTLAGITTAQSDAMFDEYGDVLARIREGAWPTAVYRLQQKQPSGFTTQAMIDSWITLLMNGMQQ